MKPIKKYTKVNAIIAGDVALNEAQKSELYKLLQEIVKYTDMEALALVTREGLRIAFFTETDADPDIFAAIAAAVLGTGEMVVSRMEHGPEMYEIMVRGESGYTILANAGRYILIGASREASSLGLAIRVLRKYAHSVAAIFDKSDTDLSGEIRELFTE